MTLTNDTQILLIDDDQDVLDAYVHLLSIAGYQCKAITDPTLATNLIGDNWAGLIVTDMCMPQLNGMELLAQIKKQDPHLPVIMITGHGDIPMAVKAVKEGACDFLEKPINPPKLLSLIGQHIKQRRSFIEQKQSINKALSRELVGHSAQIATIRELLSELALFDINLCVVGKTGTGRHNLSNLIHELSPRKQGPLVAVNAHQITTIADLENKLQEALRGSLILSSPEKLQPEVQTWLNQHLLSQEQSLDKKIRVISLFEHAPEQYITEQHLLPELYYVLNQGSLDLPELKNRPDDIIPLFHYFLKQSCKKLAKPLPKVDKTYLTTLRNHPWPGNVREIRNVAELYAIGIIKLAGQNRAQPIQQADSPLDDLIDEYEKQVLEDALYLFSGRVSDAANYLQVPRKKLYLRMKKHDIDKNDYKNRR